MWEYVSLLQEIKDISFFSGSKLSKVKSVMVSDCEKTDVCKVIVGTSVNITVDFITSKYRFFFFKALLFILEFVQG